MFNFVLKMLDFADGEQDVVWNVPRADHSFLHPLAHSDIMRNDAVDEALTHRDGVIATAELSSRRCVLPSQRRINELKSDVHLYNQDPRLYRAKKLGMGHKIVDRSPFAEQVRGTIGTTLIDARRRATLSAREPARMVAGIDVVGPRPRYMPHNGNCHLPTFAPLLVPPTTIWILGCYLRHWFW